MSAPAVGTWINLVESAALVGGAPTITWATSWLGNKPGATEVIMRTGAATDAHRTIVSTNDATRTCVVDDITGIAPGDQGQMV